MNHTMREFLEAAGIECEAIERDEREVGAGEGGTVSGDADAVDGVAVI